MILETCANAPSSRGVKLPRLTSMRFFAALAVVLTHVGYQFTSSVALQKTEVYGYDAVTFFFILSGFVMAWSYRPRPAGKFWWSRFAKIWPPQFALAVVAFTLLPNLERVPSILGRAADLTLLQAWWPSRNVYFGGNGVSWSLSCEIFFYAMVPFAAAKVVELRSRGIVKLAVGVLLVLVLAPVFASFLPMSAKLYYWLFYIFPPYQFGYFILGMLGAKVVREGLLVRHPRIAMAATIIWLAILAWIGTEFSIAENHGLPRPVVMLASLPAFMLLILAASTRDIRRQNAWLTGRPLVFLGTISFELYLIHKPLFLLTANLGWWQNSGGLAGVADFSIYIAFSVATAAAFQRWMASPTERALRVCGEAIASKSTRWAGSVPVPGLRRRSRIFPTPTRRGIAHQDPAHLVRK